MATIAQKDDVSETSELVRSHLNSVNTILLQKKSTSELLRLPEPPVRRPFTIRVENKIIKKDRLPYATGNEKEANLPRNDKSKSNKRKPKNTRKFIVGTTPESKLNKFQRIGNSPRTFLDSGQTKSEYKFINRLNKSCEIDEPQHYIDNWKPNGYHRDLVLTESQRAQKLKNQQLENARGPGFYGIPKLNDNLLKGSYIQLKSRRFEDDARLEPVKRGRLHRNLLQPSSTVPGPGTYEAESGQSCEHREGKELFSLARKYNISTRVIGSGLPPGTHFTDRDSLVKNLDKKVGNKGWYNCFTTSRWDALTTGSPNFKEAGASMNPPHLGPGVYNPKYQYHGDKVDFRQKHSLKLMSFLPHQPLNIKSSNTPGPGSYNLPPLLRTGTPDSRLFSLGVNHDDKDCVTAKTSIKAKKWKERFGFLSTTKRRDKVCAEKWRLETGDPFQGPARYESTKYDIAMKHQGEARGCHSIFQSQTPQFRIYEEKNPLEQIIERNKKILLRNRERLRRHHSRHVAVSKTH